jgi:hypothetical protein
MVGYRKRTFPSSRVKLLHHHHVALLVNLLIGLLPHHRCCCEQGAELAVTQAGDQGRRP